jgi:hypothetical protein
MVYASPHMFLLRRSSSTQAFLLIAPPVPAGQRTNNYKSCYPGRAVRDVNTPPHAKVLVVGDGPETCLGSTGEVTCGSKAPRWLVRTYQLRK